MSLFLKREYSKEYYLDHKDEVIARVKSYNEEHKDQIVEYLKEFYQEHKYQILEDRKKYYEINKDYMNRCGRDRYNRDLEYYRERKRKQVARFRLRKKIFGMFKK